MDVTLGGSRTPIERAVFTTLLENSVASSYVAYSRAIETSSISFSDLVDLARRGEIPYTLFFAPLPVVEAQVKAKNDKLLSGLNKETFSVNSRETVKMRELELIVKDLLRKQELLKKHDATLVKNTIVGLLRKQGESIEADADKLMQALGLRHDAMLSARNKQAALNYLVARLEANQVLVSQSVNNFMPQRLTGVKFSGITVKDTKVPYIFLSGGDSGDHQEPTGRRVFTLVLMGVLVARGIFAPVTYDGRITGPDIGREYDIVGEILMPSREVRGAKLSSLEEVKVAADAFKVTPSAMAVRAMRLQIFDKETTASHLEELAREYANRPKPQPRPPKPVNAVRKYAGRELAVRMLNALDAGKLTKGNFCRSVCLNKIRPSQLNDFREALQ